MTNNVVIEIGGTTYSFSIIKNNNIIFRSDSFDIQKYKKCDNFINDLYNKIQYQFRLLLEFKGPNNICIACPGPLDSQSGLIGDTPNLKIISNINLKSKIQTKFNCKVLLENDCNIFTLGCINNFNKNEVIVGITLGTGLGIGIVMNGKLFKGGNGRGPEYGLSPINNGHWEKYISSHFFREQSKLKYSKYMNSKELDYLAKTDDIIAIDIFKEFGSNLGKFLCHLINLLDPNNIIIGGGISKASNLFYSSMIKVLDTQCILYDNKLNKIKFSNNTLEKFYLGGNNYINN